jgi:hypothetical protein
MNLSKQKKKLSSKKIVSFDTFNPINNTDEFDTHGDSESVRESPMKRKKKFKKVTVPSPQTSDESDYTETKETYDFKSAEEISRKIQELKQLQQSKTIQEHVQNNSSHFTQPTFVAPRQYEKPKSGFYMSAENLHQNKQFKSDSFSITPVIPEETTGMRTGFSLQNTMTVIDY